MMALLSLVVRRQLSVLQEAVAKGFMSMLAWASYAAHQARCTNEFVDDAICRSTCLLSLMTGQYHSVSIALEHVARPKWPSKGLALCAPIIGCANMIGACA